jgi:hypothetical protein
MKYRASEPAILMIIRCELMLQPSTPHRLEWTRLNFIIMRRFAISIALLLSTANPPARGAGEPPAPKIEPNTAAQSGHVVTNVAQFRTLSGADNLAGCDFHLTGVITLVDTNRDLVVLQDATGAAALNFRIEDQGLRVGHQLLSPFFEFPRLSAPPIGE